MGKYIISIDQSTQGTKAVLFDEKGKLINRKDLSHLQIINDKGWVSHNPEEIYKNTVSLVKNLVIESGINKNDVVGIGISNQRETSLIWDRFDRKPLANAIVWQCNRAKDICENPKIKDASEIIKERTGLQLSPYFPASKLSWLLKNVTGASDMAESNHLCMGTIDTWLIYCLTEGKSYKTDYSNASRTQLFNIHTLEWDKDICELFGVHTKWLPEVCDSNSYFGDTNFEGFFNKPIPIHSNMGDSHSALFGQGCLQTGMIKATYGTGSSIMMNIGENLVMSKHGVVTSLGWRMNGKTTYVLEGNINYTGAVISWLKDNVGLINKPNETEELCYNAKDNDELYFIPAFTGLGAPYWNSNIKGSLLGITRNTSKNEIVRAGIECIAYQIIDIIRAMEEDTQVMVKELRVDGGPTKNNYLMQFQSDILSGSVLVPNTEELSAIGAAYAAGLSLGIYNESIFGNIERKVYNPQMSNNIQEKKYNGWKDAIKTIL